MITNAADQRRDPRGAHRGGRRDGLPAALPLLRPDLRAERRGAQRRLPDPDPPLRRRPRRSRSSAATRSPSSRASRRCTPGCCTSRTPAAYDMSSLRTCISGGSAMPVEVMKKFEKTFDCIVLEGYGLSETSPVASFNQPDIERKPGSIGVPVRGVEMKLVDDDGKDVEQGEVGEIAIKGENVMKGYWGKEDETEEAIPDGWFLSGDMAKQDEDGYFFIVDRKKDLIIRGGYNVYPREVEEALYEHDAVAEVAVIGIKDDDLGEEVGAAVALKDGHDGRRGGAAGLREGAAGGVQVPARGVDRRRAPQGTDRQDPAPRGQRTRRGGRPMSAATKAEARDRCTRADETVGQPPTSWPRRSTCCWPTRRSSPLRRFVPGMSGVRFTAGLARRPAARRRARARADRRAGQDRRRPLRASSRTRRTAASPRRAGPRTRCSGAPCRATSRCGEAARGLVADAELGWGDGQRMGFIVDNLVEASAPSNNPFLNPKVLKRIDRHRRRQPGRGRPPLRPRLRQRPAGALDGRARRVRGRRRHRGDPGDGGAAHRRLRADPVHPADPQGPRGPAADRAADDQQVLRRSTSPSSAAWSSTSSPAASRSTASPGATPTPGTPTGASTPTARRSSRRWTPPSRSRGRTRSPLLGICSGGMISSMVLAPPRRHRRPRPGRGLQPRGHRARPGAGRAAQRAAVAQGGGRLDPGLGGEGLPRRQGAGRGLRLAAAQRPDLELLGQQLPARPRPKAFDILYWNADPVRMSAAHAPRLHGPRDPQRAHRARRGGDARHQGRPRQDRHRHLRRRRDRRPPVQVGVLLPDHPAASAARRSSCSRPAGTSPRWSTRPATRRPASRPRRRTRPDAAEWLARRARSRAAGGTTTSSGWPSAPARSATSRRRLGSATHEPICDAPGTYVHDR